MTTDVLIIGGGVIGLATAIELKLRSHCVTIIVRDFNSGASHAAAGMLAPEAEQIPPGAMLDLCLLSRQLYPDWTSKIEHLSGLSTGYWNCGILAPVYAKTSRNNGHWLDKKATSQHQSNLSADVVGSWWYPEDGQVDNRALTNALRASAIALGVIIQDKVTVKNFIYQQNRVTGVCTTANDLIHAEHYVLATGAWSQELLPIPVHPKKGQMLSVRVTDKELPLKQVLFGSDIYIVPRADGRIIIGATMEDVGFTPYNTPAGMQLLLQRAIRLFPPLQHYPIEEFWWGFRPATPDELPILGASPYDNLTLATGHYRNGILLAPVTANLVADVINNKNSSLLEHFHYSRFYS
ncbi:glycine oxidase ThiO [Synechocystis sp. PCC 7509]|uniref:glycine oxidase ThiO n=1 Tax=Synechocystis sp. PCC 7509 TaxID=927677 RepID=UPI0002ACA136|nr:glycine oxidase ThiO [Synechocystis sp. PCC 7509]